MARASLPICATVHPIRPEAVTPPAPEAKPRDVAREHLLAALASGVRGSARDALKAALDTLDAHPRRQLTDLEYQALKPGQKLVDPSRPGFLARCSRNGIRLLYRHNDPDTGARTETLIGYLNEISLAEARDEWESMRARRMSGQAPKEETDSADSTMPTMGKLAALYLDQYASRVKRSWRGDQLLLDRHLLPDYAHLPADQFTAKTARALFATLDQTPRQRDKLRACLSTLFNVGLGKTKKVTIVYPWLPADFSNPITTAQTAKHEPWAYEPSEGQALAVARRYWAALQGDVLRRDYAQALALQLLCASRIAEVCGMSWDEIDLDQGVWAIPASRMKNGRPHMILLSRQAVALLRAREQLRAPADTFVFPAQADRTRPLRPDLLSHALAENRAALGVPETFTSHNVRVLFSTWAGNRPDVAGTTIDRCTAHVTVSGVQARYNKARQDAPAKVLWQEWADAIGT